MEGKNSRVSKAQDMLTCTYHKTTPNVKLRRHKETEYKNEEGIGNEIVLYLYCKIPWRNLVRYTCIHGLTTDEGITEGFQGLESDASGFRSGAKVSPLQILSRISGRVGTLWAGGSCSVRKIRMCGR